MEVSKSALNLNSNCKFGNTQDHPQVYNLLELTELSQAILLTICLYSKKIDTDGKQPRKAAKKGRVLEGEKKAP